MAERALRYYNACAEAGDTDAMLDLGGMYLEGRGVKPDKDMALAWYQKAAERKAPKAFRCLGNYYRYDKLDDGTPVPTGDMERLRTAFMWYKQGAELDEENSLYELGDYYRYGILVSKDEEKAFQLYCDAYDVIVDEVMPDPVSNNDSYSDVTLRLAECYHYGIGTEKDLDEAKYFIQIAKDECKRRFEDGDMYGGGSLPRAEKEWLLIMGEAGF
jgi:TPR repeat protein